MQKTFIKYTMVIITAAIFLIFVINSLLTFQTLENQQFKTFYAKNDNFGHDTGDKYLQVFSSVMHAMPVEHFLTARRSGDEFCMMIFDCEEKSEIEKFLNDFYEALKSTHIALTDTESKTISASSGFAWTADSGANLSDLLKYADEALYQMKKKTKGSYAEYSA